MDNLLLNHEAGSLLPNHWCYIIKLEGFDINNYRHIAISDTECKENSVWKAVKRTWNHFVNMMLLSLWQLRLAIRSRGMHTGENQWHWNSLWVFTNMCFTAGGEADSTLQSEQGTYSMQGGHGNQPGRFAHNRPCFLTHSCIEIELIISLIIRI